jgi:hypothetical protein
VARTVDLIDFMPDDLEAVLDAMREVGHQRNGWVNVRPAHPDDEEERLTELAATPLEAPVGLFARWRLVLIEGTWVPGKASRNGADPASVGLSHPAGRFAVRQLRDAGVPVPDGWKVVVDHTKRGLVLSVPDPDGGDAAGPVATILPWLVSAGAALGPKQMTGRWRAEIHRRGAQRPA